MDSDIPDTRRHSLPEDSHLTSADQAKSFLRSLLDKNLRVTTTDERLFWGQFKCTDPACAPHVPGPPPPRARSRAVVSPWRELTREGTAKQHCATERLRVPPAVAAEACRGRRCRCQGHSRYDVAVLGPGCGPWRAHRQHAAGGVCEPAEKMNVWHSLLNSREGTGGLVVETIVIQ